MNLQQVLINGLGLVIMSCASQSDSKKFSSSVANSGPEDSKIGSTSPHEEGVHISRRIAGEDSSMGSQQVRERYRTRDKVFDFEPPAGFEAEFSEPIMVTGASLTGTEAKLVDSCEDLSYQAEEPSFEALYKQMIGKEICGQARMVFCVKLKPISSAPDQENPQAIVFTPTAPVSLDLACKSDGFGELSISIADGAEATTNDVEKITISAPAHVIEVYLTDSPNCNEGGNWQNIESQEQEWWLDWSTEAKTETVYAKFRDIYDRESACIEDSINYGYAPLQSANEGSPLTKSVRNADARPVKLGDSDFTKSLNVSIHLNSKTASEMYITREAKCLSGGFWEPFFDKVVSWELLDLNAKNTVYVKFRDSEGNDSQCHSASVVHDDLGPTAPEGFSDGLTTSLSSQSPMFSWQPSRDVGSGIMQYEVSIGSRPGASDIKPWTSVGKVTNVKFEGLSLQWGQDAYGQIRAVDKLKQNGAISRGNGFVFGYRIANYFKAAKVQADSHFGRAIAADGKTLVVGAPGPSNTSEGNKIWPGSVHIFERKADQAWLQTAKIESAKPNAGEHFGAAVAIKGKQLLISSTHRNNAGIKAAGAVNYYEKTNDAWLLKSTITAPNPGQNELFGHAVAINGQIMAISSPREGSSIQSIMTTGSKTEKTSLNSGAVYIYKQIQGKWAFSAMLKASNSDANDEFGRSLALDGNILVVGAPSEASLQKNVTNGKKASTNNDSPNSGAAYVFRIKNRLWIQEAYLKANNSSAKSRFGESVALKKGLIAVGAPFEAGKLSRESRVSGPAADQSVPAAGAVYVFERLSGSWTQTAYVKAHNADSGDQFGTTVLFHKDRLIVGAPKEAGMTRDVQHSFAILPERVDLDSGAAYIFHKETGGWKQRAYVKAPNNTEGFYFTSQLAAAGDVLFCSSPLENGGTSGVREAPPKNKVQPSFASGAVYAVGF